MHETQLTHVKKCVIEKKDFSSEIRGRRDIDGFVLKSAVLLDIHETQLEAVVDKLLDSMFSKQHKISSVSGIGAGAANGENVNTLSAPEQMNNRLRFPSGKLISSNSVSVRYIPYVQSRATIHSLVHILH